MKFLVALLIACAAIAQPQTGRSPVTVSGEDTFYVQAAWASLMSRKHLTQSQRNIRNYRFKILRQKDRIVITTGPATNKYGTFSGSASPEIVAVRVEMTLSGKVLGIWKMQ